MNFPIKAFCFNGYNGDKISLTINEVFGFPEQIALSGGYDILCTLEIQSGEYTVISNKLISATGALYRFCTELAKCYETLEGVANYSVDYENDLLFCVEMCTGGRAVIKGTYQELPHIRNILEFEFETDQSCFPSVIEDIENLKTIFGGYEGKK